MWIDLLLTILCTAGLFAIFRLFEQHQVPSTPAIVINYAVAGAWGVALGGGIETWRAASQFRWFYIAALAGTGFLFIFRLVALSAQTIGMAPTSVASKLSMVIPVAIFLLTDPQDALTWQKAAALALALPAVVLTAWSEGTRLRFAQLRLPLTIFIGGGLIDLLFAWFSGPEHMIDPAFRSVFATLPFLSAALTGAVFLGWQHRAARVVSSASNTGLPPARDWRKIAVGGVVLGTINFGSLYFLLASYAALQGQMPRSSIIPVTNLGVVMLSTAIGVALFREHLSSRNRLGLLFGCAAILLLLL